MLHCKKTTCVKQAADNYRKSLYKVNTDQFVKRNLLLLAGSQVLYHSRLFGHFRRTNDYDKRNAFLFRILELPVKLLRLVEDFTGYARFANLLQ